MEGKTSCDDWPVLLAKFSVRHIRSAALHTGHQYSNWFHTRVSVKSFWFFSSVYPCHRFWHLFHVVPWTKVCGVRSIDKGGQSFDIPLPIHRPGEPQLNLTNNFCPRKCGSSKLNIALPSLISSNMQSSIMFRDCSWKSNECFFLGQWTGGGG